MTLLLPGGEPAGARGDAAGGEPPGSWQAVPWRTIVASVGVVLAALVVVAFVLAALPVLVLVAVAGFFAVVLAPAVAWVERRFRLRRVLATALVMFLSAGVVIGSLVLFVLPVRHQAIHAVTDLPGTIDEAAAGNGPVGRVVEQLHLQQFVRDHEDDLQRWSDDLQGRSVSIARRVVDVLVTVVTLFVLTFLMLTQSATIARTALRVVPARRRPAVRLAGRDAARAVSGYMIGNVLISLIAGVAAYTCLVVLGVPNAILLALWVAYADLIPLVGATIGAALASFAAFLHSPTAGVVAVIFFIVYQQFENSVLQPVVMSRTVNVNALVVLLSVLLGVELFGLTGAVLAIPVAGATQVAIRAAWHEYHQGRLRLEVPLAPGDEPATGDG